MGLGASVLSHKRMTELNLVLGSPAIVVCSDLTLVASSSGVTTAATSPCSRTSAHFLTKLLDIIQASSSPPPARTATPPVIHDDTDVSYIFPQHNNVFLLNASCQICNTASILFFLQSHTGFADLPPLLLPPTDGLADRHPSPCRRTRGEESGRWIHGEEKG
ncbi:Os09g0348501 [Oryza sativa Japonica Group]|uniref:Os09g0348501 protein n=1 Tax=Oryza sativa subsp. japonica TaxID=39947 RepID=A0A0P0XL90_ORYSJ|nr:Os09g0348501 [Oryza sativa Japonica Group]